MDSLEGEAVRPGLLLQVHEHALLQLVLSVADGDAVVVPVQAVDECLQSGTETGSQDRLLESKHIHCVGDSAKLSLGAPLQLHDKAAEQSRL